MSRQIFMLATLTSAFLFFATISIWALSYRSVWSTRHETGTRDGTYWELRSLFGRIEIIWARDPLPLSSRGRIEWEARPRWRPNIDDDPEWRFDAEEVHRFAGFAFARQRKSHGVSGRKLSKDPFRPVPAVWMQMKILVIPDWFLLAAFSVLPVMRRAARRRASLRLIHGACPGCGYNLTGNTSGVCAECGTPVSRIAIAPASS